MLFEEIVPLEPLHFFAFGVDSFYAPSKKLGKEHELPSLATYFEEDHFAKFFLGWHEKGLLVRVEIKGKFDQGEFPNFLTGDSIELFIDTRDVKTSGSNTRFCHHFFFLPEPFETEEGEVIRAGEVTHFRTEDAHKWCEANLLEITTHKTLRGKTLDIFIPAECLVGFDPAQFDRLGFTYRINRVNGKEQIFSASGKDFSIETQPALWASVTLKKRAA